MIAERCDSCKGELDPVADVGRFRHRNCPAPALPEIALDIIERIDRRAGRDSQHQVHAGHPPLSDDPDVV